MNDLPAIDPSRPTPPRRLLRGTEELAPMVGRRLLVGLTYVSETGDVQGRQEFCGVVLDVVDGVVVVERPGEPDPAVLPADATAYRPAQRGTYRLHSTGETVIDPDYLATWQLAAQTAS